MADLIQIFGTWLAIYSIGFTLLPITLVKDWKKRNTSDGFSSIGLVLPMLMMGSWLKHGLLSDNYNNIFLNAVNLVMFAAYVSIFAYYQTNRRNVAIQVTSLLTAMYLINSYVDATPHSEKIDLIAAIAASTQIFGLVGGIYDLYRAAVQLKTMEYIPAVFQFAVFTLVVQWTLFAYLIDNYYMLLANIAGLTLNLITISFYFLYPPLTWRVPILNIEPQNKKKD
uniref:Sugar transporter SWEET n=1 Tax=Rhabditophanes sp. KR3021 TaxID=114890 RepID=A0AC35TM92_9BILA